MVQLRFEHSVRKISVDGEIHYRREVNTLVVEKEERN